MNHIRQGQNSKRSRGRGRKPQNSANRAYDSNGPDVKIRGTATHVCEKYQQLARDAMSAGDRVMAENYYQHAEHYYRLLMASQSMHEGQIRPQNSLGYRPDEDQEEDDSGMEGQPQPYHSQQGGHYNQNHNSGHGNQGGHQGGHQSGRENYGSRQQGESGGQNFNQNSRRVEETESRSIEPSETQDDKPFAEDAPQPSVQAVGQAGAAGEGVVRRRQNRRRRPRHDGALGAGEGESDSVRDSADNSDEPVA